jgi:uncharacterized protein YukE
MLGHRAPPDREAMNTVKPGFEIEPIKVPEPLPHDPMDAHWQSLLDENTEFREEIVRLADERDKLKEACDGYLAHAANLRGENAKLEERISELKQALKQIADPLLSPLLSRRDIARAALVQSEGKR